MSNGVDFRKLALDLRGQLDAALGRITTLEQHEKQANETVAIAPRIGLRVSRENEALQQRLTVADQRVDDLEELLNFASHYLEESSFNSVGEVVEHTQEMRDEFRAKIEAALKPTTEAELSNYPECSGIPNDCPENEGYGCGCKTEPSAPVERDERAEFEKEWPNIEERLIMHGTDHSWKGIAFEAWKARAALERVAHRPAPVAAACQFPPSCTTRCDCDIPDFSPGNGNRARRREAAIEALKPENQRIVPVDPFTICHHCFGTGTICTGILESSSTICNKCDGTGREQS